MSKLIGTAPNQVPVNGMLGSAAFVDIPDLPINVPTASVTVLGGVKQGANITIAGDGTISAGNSYVLPNASPTVLGGVKVGSNLSIDGAGVLSAGNSYVLPTASPTVLGGVRVGSNLSIDGSGILNTVLGPGTLTYNPVIIATAGQTVFSVPSTYAGNLIMVYVNGYKLPPSDYQATTGTSITLNTAATAGEEIETVVFSAQAMGATSTITRTTAVATDGQTSFNVAYAAGMILVKVAGSILPASDYTANTGTNVIFNVGLSTGTEVEFIVFSAMNLINAVPSTGGTMTGPLEVPAGATGNQVPRVNEVYQKNSILGTVSQVAGVPTGAIIETGTNANGTYTKFASGLQILTGTGTDVTLPANTSTTVPLITFPAPFFTALGVDVSVLGTPDSSGDFYGVVYINSISTIALSVVARNGGTIQNFKNIRWSAIGRWF